MVKNTIGGVFFMNIRAFFDTPFDFEVKGITDQSSQVREGFLFFAMKGQSLDGNSFIQEAIFNKAIGIISERNHDLPVFFIQVENIRKAYALSSAIFYHNAASRIFMVGVTGTNGKTTIAQFLAKSIPDSGAIGTLGITYHESHFEIPNTTPSPLIIHSSLEDMEKDKIRHCFMEVSSKGILDERIAYIPFQIAIFTNLTHEHLNDHPSMEEYFLTKSRLFTQLDKDSLAIINIDSPYGKRLVKMTNAKVITTSIHEKATLEAKNIRISPFGTQFDLLYKYRTYKNITTHLLGEFNVSNLLEVIGVYFDLQIPFKDIRKMINEVSKIDGRMEIKKGKNFTSVIDFAHTPDALINALQTIKPMCKGNLITILGATGERDSTKRPLMGKIASSLSDFVIFTEEDSHHEALEKILIDLTKEIEKENYIIIPKRKEAILYASKIASYDDVLCIFGKGNERFLYSDIKVPYSDLEEIEKYL